MLWVKAFHIIFVVAWFAGLLYLPRLFVYHASTRDRPGDLRFQVMERRLFSIMSIGAIGAIAFGLWLTVDHAWAAWGASGWFRLKLGLVVALVLYHLWCAKIIADFAAGRNRHRSSFYRLINEIPALILVAAVILVTVKPSMDPFDDPNRPMQSARP
ncbi:CopD family protein [Thioalkalivibrio sp. HK1]|uniref:CopD family protein n=1 Tax=Thioalkalivibrio sp. HK1 TaxID=1469245 RepID=UPI00046E7990|nr:CopD family protein [Thioalkalivibrio sp. HK1]